MDAILASPGMLTVLVIVLIIEALSLIMMAVTVQMYRSHASKYTMLLADMGNTGPWARPGRFMLPIYILLTLGITVATVLIFVFQPHLL